MELGIARMVGHPESSLSKKARRKIAEILILCSHDCCGSAVQPGGEDQKKKKKKRLHEWSRLQDRASVNLKTRRTRLHLGIYNSTELIDLRLAGVGEVPSEDERSCLACISEEMQVWQSRFWQRVSERLQRRRLLAGRWA